MLDAVVRATAVYVVLIICVRVAGRRTIGQATTFDMLLMLIISEAVSEALTNGDPSFARAVTLVVTLIGLNMAVSLLKCKSRAIDRLLEGDAVVLVRDGVPQRKQMRRIRVDEEDLREAARQEQGLADVADVALATLERSGHISIVPKATAR